MRAITAALMVVLASGCFLPPPPGFGSTEGGLGGDPGEYKVGTSQQYQYCSATEDFGFGSKNVEGQWQDYATTFDVVTLQDGKASYRKISEDGKVTIDGEGTYAIDGSKVKITWSDGRSETVDAYVEDTPGCEMLTPRSVEGENPRITTKMYFERVSCDFSKANETTTATPADPNGQVK